MARLLLLGLLASSVAFLVPRGRVALRAESARLERARLEVLEAERPAGNRKLRAAIESIEPMDLK